MVKLLFDTNILIDYLNGVDQAKAELDLHTDKAISLVTWMEVMVGANAATEFVVKSFLGEFTSLPIDENVAILAVRLRKTHKIKLPDAIIWATAQANSRILVTRNTKDFDAGTPGIRIPYELT
jgi:predicted nucleic acid-binding protein